MERRDFLRTTTHTYTNAITMFMKTVVRERRIPFEIKASGKEQINRDAWAAFLGLRKQAAAAGVQDLSLDEINAEIQEAKSPLKPREDL